jgi:MFS family permease
MYFYTLLMRRESYIYLTYVRPLVLTGSVASLPAIFMTSICTQYYQFFLAQGFLLGIGIAFLFCPAIATVSHFCKANRGLAIGIAISGSLLGGVVWPIALNKLFSTCGFAWAVRISGFIMLPLLLLAYLTVRTSNQSTSEAKRIGLELSCPKDPVLRMLMLGFFFNYLGLSIPFFYISSYALHINVSSEMSFYMIAIMNRASPFGRIALGMLSDRCGRFNLCIFAGICSGIVCLCWTTVHRLAGLVVFSIAYGIASGVSFLVLLIT